MKKPDKIYLCWKISNWFYRHHLRIIAAACRLFIRVIFSADIPYNLTIGKGTGFPHCALGSLFHPATIIGKKCCILHGVTCGGRAGHNGLPVICDNVWIGAHAILLGDITIGEGAIIGAGSVVLHDVEPYTVVAGNPARLIKRIDITNISGGGNTLTLCILYPPLKFGKVLRFSLINYNANQVA